MSVPARSLFEGTYANDYVRAMAEEVPLARERLKELFREQDRIYLRARIMAMEKILDTRASMPRAVLAERDARRALLHWRSAAANYSPYGRVPSTALSEALSEARNRSLSSALYEGRRDVRREARRETLPPGVAPGMTSGVPPGETSGVALGETPCDTFCAICQDTHDPIRQKSELAYIPCGHGFHSSCAARWLVVSATCPVCRTPTS